MMKHHDTEAQKLATELKQAAWQEVDHLPVAEALRMRLKVSAASARALGMAPSSSVTGSEPGAQAACEDPEEYGGQPT